MITAQINLESDNNYSTHVYGETIEEVIEKIKNFHTMNLYEQDYHKMKGDLQQELDTGWWLNGR